jgi:HEAT repeat protein
MKKPSVAAAIIAGSSLLLILATGALLNYSLNKRAETYRLVTEGKPTDEQLVSFLKSNDKIILSNALALLEHRKTSAGRELAVKLLTHPDPYVWHPASLYLAALGDQRSVPYLIRGLDHPARRSRPRVVTYLRDLTGEDFGEKKQDWINWWSAGHPLTNFDFTCIGPPQAAVSGRQQLESLA